MIILAASAACRLYASLGDFWLDEIWSWWLALPLTSAGQVLTGIRHDNNHFLNTWLIYMLGPDQHWVVYRLPAVLAGVGSVAVAGIIGQRRGKLEALTAMLLIGASYLSIHYSSEARGYAYAVLFALVSYDLMERILQRPGWIRELLFGLCAVLGLLSHLTYINAYMATVAWSAWRLGRSRRGWLTLARCHTVPFLFGGWLYLTNIRHMAIGGGDPALAGDVIVQALSLALGGPQTGWLSIVLAIVALLLLATGLILLWRERRDAWLFFAVAIVAAPLSSLLLAGRDDLFVRYFLVPIAFLLLLASQVLAKLFERGPRGRLIYGVALAAFLCGNAVHTARLISLGRGSYATAIDWMLAESKSSPVTIGSDHDFRNSMVIDYYRLRLAEPDRLAYYPQDQWPPEGPEWFVRHSFEVSVDRPPDRIEAGGHEYHLVREYPYAGLSGFNWFIYRNLADGRPGDGR